MGERIYGWRSGEGGRTLLQGHRASVLQLPAGLFQSPVLHSAAEPEEEMTSTVLMEEFCFLALRTKWGIDCEKFAKNFGQSIFTVYGDVVEKLQTKNLLSVDEGTVSLTGLGMKYGNQVFAEFLFDT